MLLAAGASAPAVAPPPAVPVVLAQPKSLPRCVLTPGAQYALHLGAASGSQLDIHSEGPILLKPFAFYKEDLLREGTREYRVELDWIETVEVRAAGGYRLLRKITAAKVKRTIAGLDEGGPLPIDYEGGMATIELDERCAVISRKFESVRLPKPEQETLAQLLAQEPMAAPPETLLAGSEFIRESNTPPAFITDHYSLAPDVQPLAGSGPASLCAKNPVVLRLLRDVAIRDEGNPQFVSLSTSHPGIYAMNWCGDGLPAMIQGEFELTMREILDAPPEMFAPSVAGSSQKKNVKTKKPESHPGTKTQPQSSSQPATEANPAAHILIDYRLPSSFALTRHPLNAEAKRDMPCP